MTQVSISGGVVLVLALAVTACSDSEPHTDRHSWSPGPSASTAVEHAAGTDLLDGSWTSAPPPPEPIPRGAKLLWTGREVVVLGSDGYDATPPVLSYDPARRTWRRLPKVPAGVGHSDLVSAAWTGHEVAVISNGADLGLLNPASGTWRLAPLPRPHASSHDLLAQGDRLLLATTAGDPREDSLQMWSLDTSRLDFTRVYVPRIRHHWSQTAALVGDDDTVVLLSGWSFTRMVRKDEFTGNSGVDVFTRVGTGFARMRLPARELDVLTGGILAGDRVLFPPQQPWRAFGGPVFPDAPGVELDLGDGAVRNLPRGPVDDSGPTLLATGTALVAVRGGAIVRPVTKPRVSLAAYDAERRAWRAGPRLERRLDRWTTPVATVDAVFARSKRGGLLELRP